MKLPLILKSNGVIIIKQTPIKHFSKEIFTMNANYSAQAKEKMNQMKMEASNEVGVNLKPGYNGDLTAKQAGSIGGQMVKKMITDYAEK